MARRGGRYFRAPFQFLFALHSPELYSFRPLREGQRRGLESWRNVVHQPQTQPDGESLVIYDSISIRYIVRSYLQPEAFFTFQSWPLFQQPRDISLLFFFLSFSLPLSLSLPRPVSLSHYAQVIFRLRSHCSRVQKLIVAVSCDVGVCIVRDRTGETCYSLCYYSQMHKFVKLLKNGVYNNFKIAQSRPASDRFEFSLIFQ